MWDCEACGCLAIAASLTACPVCQKEGGMAKATVEGGGSAGGVAYDLTGEPAAVEEEVPPAPKPKPAAKPRTTTAKAAADK